MKFAVVVPWHSVKQREMFFSAWFGDLAFYLPLWLFLQQDTDRSGCALTKNRGIRRAIDAGAEVIVVLDDDCFPTEGGPQTLTDLAVAHIKALAPQDVEMFRVVTDPPSRGTPYFSRTVKMPVAASLGFWTHVGDYDACAQLVRGATTPMRFDQRPIFGQAFAYCGMNVAFYATEWPHCQFVNVPRFDDIWAGFIFQKIAYAQGRCFNLGGPLVKHSRQSAVFQNLRDEAPNLEKNEILWQKIWANPSTDYDTLIGLLDLS